MINNNIKLPTLYPYVTGLSLVIGIDNLEGLFQVVSGLKCFAPLAHPSLDRRPVSTKRPGQQHVYQALAIVAR